MSLAKKIEQRGRLEGILEIAMIMLKDGVEPVFVSKYTGLPLAKVQELMKNCNK